MPTVVLSCLFILFQSVNPLTKPKPLFKYQKLHPVDMSKYAVLPGGQQLVNSFFEKGYRAAVLTATDFVEIDNILIKAVDDHNKGKEYGFIYNPDKYYKQIVSATNAKGEVEVYINCLCAVHYPKNWKTQFAIVMDGGNCYFQVKINLTAKKIISFTVNGVA